MDFLVKRRSMNRVSSPKKDKLERYTLHTHTHTHTNEMYATRARARYAFAIRARERNKRVEATVKRSLKKKEKYR